MTSERQKKKGWILPEQLTGYPMICVQFQCPDNQYYRAAVLGAVHQLAKWWNWEKSYAQGDQRATQAASMWRQIIYDTFRFIEECPDVDGKKPCQEYPLDSPILEWNPNDPFRTPELVPAGYAFPPWYKANSITGITLGTSPGDIVTDITRTQSIPVIPPASGYPRLRIHLKGSGTVELHLVKLNAGGYVQITTDDDIFSAEFCSLNKDLISIPPESTDDIVIEREVQGTGDHHIDLLFVPRVNDELLPPVTQGGAIRKIVLCGFDEMDDCPDCEECEDCPEPCGDDCDELEDFLEDWCFDDLPELEDYMYYAAPFVGQLVAGVVPPTSGGWLLCNGSSVNKADYPELYQVLLGKVGEDDTTFNLPDFTDRIPMGAGTIVDVLAAAGESEHTLTEAEMPEHQHDVAAHTHGLAAHYHHGDQHTHDVTLPNHQHQVVVPSHTHDIPVRNNLSAFGAEVIAAGANATSNSTRSTSGGGGGTFNTSSSGAANLTTAENSFESTATGPGFKLSDETPFTATESSGGGETSAVGGGAAFPIIPPVIGVNWFIFAGGKECC